MTMYCDQLFLIIIIIITSALTLKILTVFYAKIVEIENKEKIKSQSKHCIPHQGISFKIMSH